jgi:hypothetical protein
LKSASNAQVARINDSGARTPQPAASPEPSSPRLPGQLGLRQPEEHQPYSIEAQDTRLAAYIGSQPGCGRPQQAATSAAPQATETDRRRAWFSDERNGVRVMTNLVGPVVGLTCHSANRPSMLVAGPEIPFRPHSPGRHARSGDQLTLGRDCNGQQLRFSDFFGNRFAIGL